MGREVSIAISAKDNFTQAITTMRNANSAFDKDLSGMMEKLDTLNKTKITLKVDTDKARDDLKAAEKQYLATGDAADKMALEVAGANYDNAKRNLDLVSQNAKQAEKSILNMTDAVSKADNRAGTAEKSQNGLFSRMADAGMTKMIGDSLSGMADTYISSAFSDKTGAVASGILNGITSGAALGTMIDPGMGTAVGAAVGSVTGAINAVTQNFKNKDDAFKSDVQDAYNSIEQSQTESLTSGTETAIERERDLRSFSSLMGNNTIAAQKFQQSLIEIGRTPPFSYGTVSALSKEMIGLGDSTGEAQKKISDLANASSALGWTSSDAESISSTLDAALENGTISSRVLKTLDKSGLNSEEAISQAFGIKKSDVAGKIGKMDAASVINALYNYMGKKYKGASASMADTYEGAKGIADSYDEDQQASMGKGYTSMRQSALESHNKLMAGSTGKGIQQANEMLGAFQADLDNTKEELIDSAKETLTSGVLTGAWKNEDNKKRLQDLAKDYQDQYKKYLAGDKEAGAQAGNDMAEAQVIAQNEYMDTSGYKIQLESQKSLIQNIRDDKSLQDDYWKTGFDMGQQFTMGLAKAQEENVEKNLAASAAFGTAKDSKWAFGGNSAPGTQSYDGTTNPVYGREAPKSNQWAFGGSTPQHATGINRVPYNEYPALLHEDEMVLTGAQGRAARQGTAGKVEINFNGTIVREEADIDKIARAIASELKKASLISG